MTQIEPNGVSLVSFSVLWSICCLAFVQLAGMYPLGANAKPARSPSATLVVGNTVLWLALLAGTMLFAYIELRWTSIVVIGGILFLFLPELFQLLPEKWRDGQIGLAVASCVLVVALGLLAYVGGGSIMSLLT
jgi:uncharacterized membrane protein